jgi:LacI family transcriptional regulator
VVNLQEHPDAWENQQDQLESWLRGLTTPVGIMASSDLRAGMLLEACRKVGLRVPEEVAIIGVDNDPVACEFSQPQLTSISRNDHRVGFEAASMLHRMILGQAPPGPVSLRIPPDRVVARKSTEVLAVDDPEVALLIQQMRERFHESIGMENLAGKSALSRRRLEQRFRATMDISPAVFLNQLRVEHAKKLLARKPILPLADIAAQCGFRDPRRFRVVFMRLTGSSPVACRRELDSSRSD